MSTYTIETKLFGKIEVTESDGLIADFDIVLGGKNMAINFQVFEDVANDDTIEIIENMLDNIPLMYEKGKEIILTEKESNAIIKSFIEDYFDDIDEYAELFDVNSSNEITTTMIAKNLEPRSIFITNDNDDMIDCIFDFSLSEEYTDQLLVISFNDKYEICHITHES